LWGDLTARKFVEALYNTVKLVGNILFIIYAAYIFSYAISFAGVGEDVTKFVVGLELTKLQFFPRPLHPLHNSSGASSKASA